MLEEPVFANALRVIATTPKSCSNNIMLGMAEGFGIDFECAPDEAFPIYPGDDQLIVHANHWISGLRAPLLNTGYRTADSWALPGLAVRQLLNAAPKVDRNAVKAALFDNFGNAVLGMPSATQRHAPHHDRDRRDDRHATGNGVPPLPALNRIFTR